MDDLYLKCSDIIRNNMKIDDDLVDVFTTSFMALYLEKGSIVLEKLPSLLERAQIERNDQESTSLNISVVGKRDDLREQICFTFPTKLDNFSFLQMTTSILFELIQLLRYKGLKIRDDSVEIKAGILSRNISLDNGRVQERGTELEEAIVGVTTKNAMIGLGNYLEGENNCSISSNHRQEILSKRCYYYDIRTYLMEKFMENENFASMVNNSFADFDIRKFAVRYNDIMDNDAAFFNLIKEFDNLSGCLIQKDEKQLEETIGLICTQIDSFNNKSKQLRK